MAKENGKHKMEGLEFNLSHITAREMQVLLKAAAANDYDKMAELFTKIISAFPLGDPTDPDTYLDLPYYTTDESPLSFTYVMQAMVEAGKNVASK